MKLKNIVALAATSIGLAAFAAPTPIAVWDGDFSAAELNKFADAGITLVDWQQTHGENNSSVTIDRANQGLMIQSTTAMPGITVLARYSNLATGTKRRVIATSCVNSDNSGFRTGIQLTADGTLQGMWRDGGNGDANGTASGSIAASGVLAFVYSTAGTYLYYGATTDAISSTTSWGSSGLKSSSDTSIYGAAIGGFVAASSITGYEAALGMTIEAIAVFNKVLTNAEMTSYVWPSEIETITISGNTTVSDINTQVAAVTGYREIVISLDDGATVDVDAAFASSSIPYTIASEGSITLSAESRPDASYFTNADFSGVKGGLLRSWLTPGVVGFNFRSGVGTDASGALATGTWYNDGGNQANGTSTALFADGLSTLTWASANTWSYGSGSILSGYLDDGALNGKGAEVTLSNVPYEEYDVIIYCNSDSNPGNFLAKTVNGTTYTWDSDVGAVVEGSGTWGKAALAIPVYGVNTLRIKNLTGPLTIYGTPRSGISRGGIAAIQIMPPDTPDNIRTYTLTLDGTATTWSEGNWTLEGNQVDAPTAGNVKIVASASTTVTVDAAVSLATLTVEGSEDAVVSLVPGEGEGNAISTINAVVKGGVLKQGAANLVAGTLTVEDGGTFDFGGFASQANVRIAGAGAGNSPWALTSTGVSPLGSWTSLILDADATVGGAGTIKFGKSNAAGTITYNGHTLTKAGAGELVLTNGRTAENGTGTLDIVEGTVTLEEYTCFDGYETIYAHTKVIVRNGAELKNSTDRLVWIDTLEVEDGATITLGESNYFGVTSKFIGTYGDALDEEAPVLTKLQFNDGATATLTGDLTVGTLVGKGDNSNSSAGTFSLALDELASGATVTVTNAVEVAGEINCGTGVVMAFAGEEASTGAKVVFSDPDATDANSFYTEPNWKGTIVLDYEIADEEIDLSALGTSNSKVCFRQSPATGVSFVYDWDFNQHPAVYLEANMTLCGGELDDTEISCLGANQGVTLTLGVASGEESATFDIGELQDFAGSLAVGAATSVEIGNVVLAELPAEGALVVSATVAEGGTLTGAVTVGEESVELEYKTVNDVSGLYVAASAPDGTQVIYGDSTFTVSAELADLITAASGVAADNADFGKAAIAYVVGGTYDDGEIVIPTPTITIDGTTVTVVFSSEDALVDAYDITCTLQYAEALASSIDWANVTGDGGSDVMDAEGATLTETVAEGTANRFYRVVVTIADTQLQN